MYYIHRRRLAMNIGRAKKWGKFSLTTKFHKKFLYPPKFFMTFLIIDSDCNSGIFEFRNFHVFCIFRNSGIRVAKIPEFQNIQKT